MKLFITVAVVLTLGAGSCARAQETVLFQAYFQDINCATANNDQSANQVLYLENYFDALQTQLPDALPVVETTFWLDGPGPIPSNLVGNLTYAIDAGRAYSGDAGYPLTQFALPTTLKSLGQWVTSSGRKQRDRYWPPINYRIGKDSFIVAAECASSPTGVFVAAPIITIGYVASEDIPKPPPENYLANIPASSLKMTFGNVPYTLRSTIPAPSVAVTSIRARVLWPEYNGPAPIPPTSMTITHLSIGTRSGSTSSTTAAPMPLTFHRKPSWHFWSRQAMWSDCIDFSSPAGQQLLLSASVDQPANAYTYYDGLGLPAWYVPDASQWSSVALSGNVGLVPSRLYVADRVQINCK